MVGLILILITVYDSSDGPAECIALISLDIVVIAVLQSCPGKRLCVRRNRVEWSQVQMDQSVLASTDSFFLPCNNPIFNKSDQTLDPHSH